MEDDKESVPHDDESTRDKLDNNDSLMTVDVEDGGSSGSADGGEDRKDGNSLPTQPTGVGDSLSLSSDGSENERLRSRVPRVNCPEHIVSS